MTKVLRFRPKFFRFIDRTHKNFKKVVGATSTSTDLLVIACELLVIRLILASYYENPKSAPFSTKIF
jgi:hypothetical protein